MAYQRIQPFPAPDTYQFPELRALTSVWKERKAALEGDGAYKDFIKKLQREWAIETGIIERLYTWDRGVTELSSSKVLSLRSSRIGAACPSGMPNTSRR